LNERERFPLPSLSGKKVEKNFWQMNGFYVISRKLLIVRLDLFNHFWRWLKTFISRDRCYDFKNIFVKKNEQKWRFCSNYVMLLLAKIGSYQKRQFFAENWRKSQKIVFFYIDPRLEWFLAQAEVTTETQAGRLSDCFFAKFFGVRVDRLLEASATVR
jgi:hypothetical protein